MGWWEGKSCFLDPKAIFRTSELTYFSTEWVEEYTPWLKAAAVSYLNIDVGVSGTVPDFSASPELHPLITETAKKVIWPHGEKRTIHDVWKENTGKIDPLGAQSDYTAFVHRGGISAMDIGTTRGPLDPIYHTHSNFDSYHWMTKFGDPRFAKHKAIGQFLTLMLFHLVDDDLVPLDPINFGKEMKAWLFDLQKLPWPSSITVSNQRRLLQGAVEKFNQQAKLFTYHQIWAVARKDVRVIKELNRRARHSGREFINHGGLHGRPFYQHLLFAPGIDTGYRPVVFPAIREAVSAGNFTLASEELGRTADAVYAAARVLTSS